MQKLCLVVINRNDLLYLPKFFSSIEKQKLKVSKILFVDNASTDGSLDYVKKMKSLPIKIILFKENLLFDVAINAGLREALNYNCEYIGIINSDMYFEKDCFSKLVSYLESNSSVVAVQPKLYKIGSNELTAPPLKVGLFKFQSVKTDNSVQTSSLSGSALFTSVRALKKSGLFYEPFFHYSEDSYLTYCLSKYGKTMWISNAVGYHRVGLESKERLGPAFSVLRKLKTRNGYILALKTFFSRPGWLIFCFFDFFKEVFLFVIGNKSRSIRFDYISGYLWGFKETFFHLFNNEKYLNKGINHELVPKL